MQGRVGEGLLFGRRSRRRDVVRRHQLVAAQQQHVAAAIELRRRLHFAFEEGAAVVGTQRLQRADREPRREAPAHARGQQHVAGAHIGGQRHVGGLQRIAAAAAVDHQAHAAARHHRRHRMVGVGDQQHGGGGRGRGDHLPHQPAGVDHRLADAHAVAAAGIQHQSLAGGIEVDVEDAGKLHVQPRALGAGQQAAQPRVLRRRRLQARIARARDQQRIAQQFVVAHQLAAGHRVLAQGHARARRQPGQPPQRLHRDFRLRPRRAQPAAAVVQHHQHHRQHQIRQQAQHAGDIAGAGCGRSGVGRHVSGSANAVAVRNSGEAAVWPMEGPTQTTMSFA